MSEVNKMLKSSNEIYSESDPKGRTIKVRKPSALQRYRFVGMLGKAADSDRYMSMVGALVYLYAVDDYNEIPLNTVREMEALIQLLGDEGIETLNILVAKNFVEEDAAKEKAEVKE